MILISDQDEQVPFKGHLQDVGFDTDTGKINQIAGTDTLARRVTEAELALDLQYRGLDLTVEEYVAVGADELRNLASYGIVLPHFQLVWGGELANKVLYTAVGKVEGIGLMEAIHTDLSDDFKLQLNILYRQLATYYSDKLTKGGYYIDDLKNSHFVWGKTKDDDSPRIYMVDLDARVSHFDKENIASEKNQEFYSRIGYFSHMIREVEEAGASIQTEARELFMYTLENNPLPPVAEKTTQKIKHNLVGI